MKNETVEKILSELETGYDLIADKFSATRAFMWRDLGFVRDMVKPGDRVLDFGCGNGRLAGFLFGKLGKLGKSGESGEYIGVDISQKLIDLAKQRYSSEKTEFIKVSANTKRSDRAAEKESGRTSFALPFDDDSFDIVFSIAVFHHFPSREYALKITKELHRVLKPGGKIIVTVWNLWQEQYQKFHLGEFGKLGKWGNVYIPFKSGEKVFNRYHHPFKMKELKELFQEAGFKTLKTKEGWNLVYIGKKSDVDKRGLTRKGK